MSLRHPAGCEAGFVDFDFPHSGGTIGAWGYDFRVGQLVSPNTGDLMSYCENGWISDYHFTNAARYRLYDEGRAAAAVSASTRSLLLWGGVGHRQRALPGACFRDRRTSRLSRLRGRIPDHRAERSRRRVLLAQLHHARDGRRGREFRLRLCAARASRMGRQPSNHHAVRAGGAASRWTERAISPWPSCATRGLDRCGASCGTRCKRPRRPRTVPGCPLQVLRVLFSRGIPGAAAWRR